MKHKVRWWWWWCPELVHHRTAFSFLLLFSLVPALYAANYDSDINMPHQELVEYWANKMGNHIFHLSDNFAQYKEIKQNFMDANAKVRENDGLQLVKEMANDVTNMMKFKVDAVKRIMNVAEEASLDEENKRDEEFKYYNAKRLNEFVKKTINGQEINEPKNGYRELRMVKNSHFDNLPVNENVSSVHVPTNVYDEAPGVMEAIRWSARLDRTFRSNYELDPTLSWQYFGSSTGFLRQYPAAEWLKDGDNPDLYDARLRSWYIEAANSPKDMVILLDESGSMKGLRKEIAKHVVLNILETLNENDFVNVFTFSKETLPLVPCFNDTLVQANLENLGQFKEELKEGKPREVANFTKALTTAFELLQRYNKSGLGSQCNQAIMMVTDGAPYTFEDIFKMYNWPQRHVRMFTYLIGQDEKKVRFLNWMACANKGYFVHVTTLAEVREQVLKYIPVMARPMVMYQSNHPHRWTGVYADVATKRHGYMDPKQTDWLWKQREQNRQKERTNNYRKLQNIMGNGGASLSNPYVLQDHNQVEKFLEFGKFELTERDIARIKAEKEREMRRQRLRREAKSHNLFSQDFDTKERFPSQSDEHRRLKRVALRGRRIKDWQLRKWHRSLAWEQEKLRKWREDIRMGRRDSPGMTEGYRLMTTVSVPVFDRKKTSNITERVLNESVWVLRKREVKTANLLGVAGTDVPIREIEKLVPPYKLGVNGYSFMVNTNGYVLYHPDLRPVFQDILKPNYNSVDFAEVELPDDDSEPRENNTDLLDTGGRYYNSKLRRGIIEHQNLEQVLKIKSHLDDMKRLVQREQRYFTQGIDGTPFSLGIAMPQGYGRYKVYGQIELSLEMSDPRSNKAIDHFSTGNWSLHPDWVYCEYKYNQEAEESNRTVTPEDQMLDFLSRAEKPHWKWRSTRTRPPPEPTMAQSKYATYKQPTQEDDRRDNYYCDKDLVQSLLFDAQATNVYFDNVNIEERIEDRDSNAHQRFGITAAFVATRSGLTRWQDLSQNSGPNPPDITSQPPHFMKIHNRAIDEVWYKRAVDYYDEDPDAYVYSVPFDAATRNPEEVLVTATRAIFIEENSYRRAPAAVVGVTIKHKEFVTYFKNETHKCPSYPSTTNNCKTGKTCDSPSLDCYLLDDNGFVVVSEDESDTGKFFGTLEGTIMESLVQSEVYKRVRIFDFQAVCLDSKMENNSASFLTTPIQMMKWAAHWMVSNVFWMLVKTQLYTLWDPNQAWAYTHPDEAHYPNLGNKEHQEYPYEDYKGMTDETLPPAGGWSPMYLSDESVPEAEIDTAGFPTPNYDDNINEGVPPGASPDDGVPQYPQDYDEEPDGGYPSLEEKEMKKEEGKKRLKDDCIPFKLAYINTTHPRPCDKEVYLYKLQNHKLKQDGAYKPVKGKLSNCHTNGCGRPFSVQKVRSTNLILVAVNNLCPCDSRKLDIEPVEVKYDEEQKCRRLLMQHYRKRPPVCVNYHPDENREQDIKLCGGAGSLGLPSCALLSLLLVVHVSTTLLLRS